MQPSLQTTLCQQVTSGTGCGSTAGDQARSHRRFGDAERAGVAMRRSTDLSISPSAHCATFLLPWLVRESARTRSGLGRGTWDRRAPARTTAPRHAHDMRASSFLVSSKVPLGLAREGPAVRTRAVPQGALRAASGPGRVDRWSAGAVRFTGLESKGGRPCRCLALVPSASAGWPCLHLEPEGKPAVPGGNRREPEEECGAPARRLPRSSVLCSSTDRADVQPRRTACRGLPGCARSAAHHCIGRADSVARSRLRAGA